MKLCLCFIALSLLATPISAWSQSDTGAGDTFCDAGLRPDGYIDFSTLPAAPTLATGASSTVTATLPVQGISGLTVTVTIPPRINYSYAAPQPLYTVTGGTLQLNGTSQGDSSISLEFNQPIAGLGLVAGTAGASQAGGPEEGDRPEFTTFILTAGTPTGFESLTPAPFTKSVSTNSTQFGTGLAMQAVDYSSAVQRAIYGAAEGFETASVANQGGGFGAVLSNFRVQSTAVEDLSSTVPKDGLQQWLQSSPSLYSLNYYIGGGGETWPDQSGHHHDATQTAELNWPTVILGVPNHCAPAFQFTGSQFFNFNLPINGWQQMTIFLVSSSQLDPASSSGTSAASAIFWNENAYWGNTFVTPYQANTYFRFGTTQAGNQPVYAWPATIGQDFTVTRAVHDGNTDSLYVNGIKVLSQGDKFSSLNGTTGAAFLGRGLNNTYFNGEIAEVLIYNRVLTVNEAASVEKYLRDKFGIE